MARLRRMPDIEARITEMIAMRERECEAIEVLLTPTTRRLPAPNHVEPAPESVPEHKVDAKPSLKEPVARALRARMRPVVPEPEPAVILPQPTVEAAPETPKTPPRETIRRNQAFAKREREFFREGGTGRERLAELKSLVCEARGLIEASADADLDPATLWQSVELLREEFDRLNPGGSFFAFAPRRSHRPSLWGELAEAFASLIPADRCLDWVEAHPEAPERAELLRLAGAAEAWIHRLNDEYGLGFTDEQQRDVHHRVETLAAGEVYVPWWSQGENRRPTGEVVEAARALPGRFADILKRLESSARKDDAMSALEGLVQSLEAEGPVEETLIPAVIHCLDAGIPPSNKRLVGILLPYRATLKEIDDRRVAKLVEYLSKEEALLARRHGPPVDSDAEVKVEDQAFQAVRAHLEGRTMLFIGGRRIPEKQKEIEQALGLKALLWPDADPDTLLHDFTASVIKADIVCYLIRWSRHSYKQVIDFAKAQGKETIVLKAGVGINRVVHDVFEQLPKD